jgi:hypothetical protein
MIPNRLAFWVLVVACVAAAGVGGYVATRQSPPAQAAAQVQATPAATPVGAEPSPAPSPASAAASPVPAETPSRPAQRAKAGAPAHQMAARTPQRQSKPNLEHQPAPDQALAAASPAPAAVSAPPAVTPVTPENPPLLAEVEAVAPPEPPSPPPPTFEELVVPAESVIGLQNETSLSSESAQVEDRVEARVTRDVRVHGQVAIPAGARAIGTVTEVDQGGRFRDRAQLSIRFDTIILSDGTRLPVSTDVITRYGDSPNGSAKVGGGAVAGAILGAILGGAKGAAVGATAGAGAGTAAAIVGGRNEATLPAGTPITVRILSPISVTLDQQ